MKQHEFNASKLIVVQIPVHPLLPKQQRSDEHVYMMQAKHPQWKTLPQDYLHHLSGQSLSGMTQLTAIPPTIFATTPTRPGMERSFVMMTFRNAGRDAIQSRVSVLFKRFITNSVIKNGSRLPNTDAAVRWRQRFRARDQTWGTPRAWHRTPFPDSLQKLLPEHADLHADTQQMHLDQQHLEFWTES